MSRLNPLGTAVIVNLHLTLFWKKKEKKKKDLKLWNPQLELAGSCFACASGSVKVSPVP